MLKRRASTFLAASPSCAFSAASLCLASCSDSSSESTTNATLGQNKCDSLPGAGFLSPTKPIRGPVRPRLTYRGVDPPPSRRHFGDGDHHRERVVICQ